MTRLAPLLLFALVASGCTRTRVVTVQGEAPPPSVVTQSDTLYLASPPDTLYLETVRTRVVAGDTVRLVVTRTVPERVVEYVTARPDSADAVRVLAVAVDSAEVTVFGVGRDWRYRAPEDGETLLLESDGPDDLTASVVGVPSRPPPVSVEVPACPRCLYSASLPGRLRLGLSALVVFAVGVVVGLFVRGATLARG